MAYLVDTNVLLRRARPGDPNYPAARNAIDTLAGKGEAMYISSQNVIECWNVLTRPAGTNGFGLSPSQADYEVTQLESFFRFLNDTPDVYAHWRKLVVSLGVSGVKVHDARLSQSCWPTESRTCSLSTPAISNASLQSLQSILRISRTSDH